MLWKRFCKTCVLAIALLLAIAGCDGDAKPAARDRTVNVSVARVLVRPVQRTVEVVGTLHGTEDAVISAKVSGRIVAIGKDIGDRVRAGELLLQIDATDYTLALEQRELAAREALAKLGLNELPTGQFDPTLVPTVQQAKLKADNEEAKFNRGKQLHEAQPPLLSDQDYADLQTGYQVAKSTYDVELLSARALLNQAQSLAAQARISRQAVTDATVLAPTPARSDENPSAEYSVASRLVSVGEYVREGTPLMRLIDDDPVKLRASTPEAFIAEVKVGQSVKVKIEAYAEAFTGTVTRINPQIDPANRTFVIEAVIPNDQHNLKPGAFAQASVLTKLDDRVIFVPQAAIVTFAGVYKVFTVDEKANAMEHVITPGQSSGEMVEVLKGLAGDEQVVIDGTARLATGVPVKIKPLGTTQAATRPM